jgi:cbb3-type cytochrome oxidase subunit 1
LNRIQKPNRYRVSNDEWALKTLLKGRKKIVFDIAKKLKNPYQSFLYQPIQYTEMDFLRQIHLDTKRIFFPFGVAASFSIYQMIATTTCTTCKGKKKGFSFLLLFLLLRRK